MTNGPTERQPENSMSQVVGKWERWVKTAEQMRPWLRSHRAKWTVYSEHTGEDDFYCNPILAPSLPPLALSVTHTLPLSLSLSVVSECQRVSVRDLESRQKHSEGRAACRRPWTATARQKKTLQGILIDISNILAFSNGRLHYQSLWWKNS